VIAGANRESSVATKSGRHKAGAKAPVRAPVDLHWGRLGLLMLLLVGAAFYVAPLRAFFAQQDRHSGAAAQLSQTQQQNAALKAEIVHLRSAEYVAEKARADFQLVPSGMQAFVVKGLPQEPTAALSAQQSPVGGSMSIADRMRDLWSTLLR
jgi:cell division protein FtsB